jgi:PAS domain S-box-containing protein
MRHTPLKIASICVIFTAIWMSGHHWIRQLAHTTTGAYYPLPVIIFDVAFIIITALLLYLLFKNTYRYKQYEQLFQDHPIPIWIYEKSTLRFLAVNQAAIDKYGYSRKEFLQLTIADIREKSEVPQLMENIREKCNGVEYRGKWKHCTKYGKNFFVEIYAHSGKYDGKEVRIIMAKDVDAQVKAGQKAIEIQLYQQEEINKLSLVASKTKNAVLIANANEDIEWVNESFINQFGFTLEEVLGKKPRHFLLGPHADAQAIKIAEDGMRTKAPFTIELMNYHKNGRKFWVRSDVSPVLNEKNEIEKFVVIITDITERKQFIHKLEEQNKALRQIAWSISHEVRSPVVSILSITDLFDKSNSNKALNGQLMDWLFTSTTQLDEIIHKIDHRVKQLE